MILGKRVIVLIGGIVIISVVLSLCMQKPEEGVKLTPTIQPEKELKLSDFPEVFKENTLIVIGNNASNIEIQAAKEIADYLEGETENKPLIKKYSEVTEEDRRNYNLIVVGTPNSNPMLKEIYAVADVLEVNETFPGKGVLEILRSPWSENKAMLLVEGWDEWGVRTGSLMIVEENKKLTKERKFVDWVEYTGVEFPIDSDEEAIRYAKIDYGVRKFIKEWSAKGFKIKIWAEWDSYHNVWEVGVNPTNIKDILFLLRFKPDGGVIQEGLVPTA